MTDAEFRERGTREDTRPPTMRLREGETPVEPPPPRGRATLPLVHRSSESGGGSSPDSDRTCWHVGRRKPASGVLVLSGQPTIVFLTVCTRDRQPWLAQEDVHATLCDTWQKAQAWLVGCYLLMPDHLHLFCAPRDLTVTVDNWVKCWKRMFSRAVANPSWVWQSGHWDTRLRRTENYEQKWTYIRENPVRKNLVKSADDWPYQGMLNVLQW